MTDVDTRLEVFEKLLFCSGNIFLWKYSSTMKLEYTNCPHSEFWGNIFSISSCNSLLKQHMKEHTLPILLEDEFHFVWIAAPFLINNELANVYMLGPVLSSAITEARIAQQLQPKNCSLEFKRNLISKVRLLPIFPVYTFLQYGLMLYFCLYETYISIKDISSHTNQADKPDAFPADDSFRSTKHEVSRQNELLLKKLVREGNINYESLLDHSRSHPSPGILSWDDPTRQAKNEMIVLSVILSRAAIEGGYPAENALSMNDYYIQAIEREDNIPNLYHLGNQMIDTFIHRVHDYKNLTEFSELIKQCIAYIELHILKPFDLSHMADTLGYDKYYLSKCFKKETGISVSAYIKRARVEYSKILLSDRALKISEISSQLYFANPSHFIAAFREQNGITPNEYRGKQ